VVTNSSFTDGISGSYDVTEQDYSTALVDNGIYQFGDFTAAEDNPIGIDSDVSLANGDRIEIDTVPGEYTNSLRPRQVVQRTGSKRGARQLRSCCGIH
jgi:hypothetical protein